MTDALYVCIVIAVFVGVVSVCVWSREREIRMSGELKEACSRTTPTAAISLGEKNVSNDRHPRQLSASE